MKTTGLFTTHRVELEVETGKPFKLIPFGDVHRDSDLHADEHWNEFLAYAKAQKNAVFVGMGDYCMPLDAQIMTTRGWKLGSELQEAEQVLAYDAEADETKWVPLIGIVLNPPAPTKSMSSKSFRFDCTGSHAWYVRDDWWYGAKRIKRVEADSLKTSHKVIMAAPCRQNGSESFMTDDEAWLLGWIVTDGHSRKGNYCDCNIAQSESKYAAEIGSRLADWFTGVYANHRESDCLTFNIANGKARELFQRIGYRSKSDLPALIPKLGKTAKDAMLDAMLKAEGWKEAGNWRFSQKRGPVLDAFQMLVVLSGKRLGLETEAGNGVVSIRILSDNRQFARVADMSITDGPVQATWCPRTPLRSWVVKYRGCISITGNCDGVSTSERIVLSDAGLHDTTRRTMEGVYKGVAKTLVNELSFMKGRLLGLLGGNHYMRFENGDTTDHILAAALGTKFLGVCSFIRLSLSFRGRCGGGGCKKSLDLFAHHGKGGGSLPGSTFNTIEKMAASADADIYLMGHDHKKGCIPSTPRLVLNGGHNKGELIVRERTPWLGRTGSFLKAYENGRVSYNVDAARSPCSLGWIEFEITPVRTRDGGVDEMSFRIRGTS